VSVALALTAIANEVIALGALPRVSLFLAHLRLLRAGAQTGAGGRDVRPVAGDPDHAAGLPALRLMAGAGGHAVFGGHDPVTSALRLGAGILTALPLMAFAAATQRLDLATVGMLTYVNPTLQFLTAVWLFDEPLQPARVVTSG